MRPKLRIFDKTNFIILNQTEYKHPHAGLQVLNTRKLTPSL